MKYSIFKVVAVKTKYEDLHFSWHLEFFCSKVRVGFGANFTTLNTKVTFPFMFSEFLLEKV